MEPDDDEDDPEPFRSQRNEERIWLHPSELGSLLEPAPPGPVSHGLWSEPAGRRSVGRALAVPILSGMVGAALSLGILLLSGGLQRPATEQVVERVADRPLFNVEEPEDVARLAAAVAPAIVGLRATTPTGDRFGSGVVFRSDGHVLTNQHLIDGAGSIEITGADGRSWVAHAVGSDPESDLAVLSVANARMQPAVLGSASGLRVGQTAVVVGAPAGPQGSPSVTAGVIAGLGEVVEVGGRPLYDMIATDATIAPRATGGPLVDRSGAVVGITTTRAVSGEDHLGLVVPIDLAHRVADKLISDGRVVYPWLGLSGTDLDPWTAKEYGVVKGTLIRRVSPKSPADKGGVEVQDVVTAVEKSPISTMNELMMLVRRHEPGDQINLTVVRSGLTRTVKVRLDAAPAAVGAPPA
jgi:S1-C subfamily serine protease